MNREEKVMDSIQKSINVGYVFLTEGTGSQDDALTKYRSQGYDVRGWYTQYTKDSKSWVMYGKMKGQRKKTEKNVIDYSVMNVKELRVLCKEHGIKGYGKMRRDQMIQSLEQH